MRGNSHRALSPALALSRLLSPVSAAPLSRFGRSILSFSHWSTPDMCCCAMSNVPRRGSPTRPVATRNSKTHSTLLNSRTYLRIGHFSEVESRELKDNRGRLWASVPLNAHEHSRQLAALTRLNGVSADSSCSFASSVLKGGILVQRC